MSSQTIARRYATALADVLGEQHEEAAVRDELSKWEQMVASSPSLLEIFSNPTVGYEQKQKVLSELISRTKPSQTTENFLRVLLRNQRMADLPQVTAKLSQILDERSGVISAEVTSAQPLPVATTSALALRLGEITGKKVSLNFKTDESLLGGIVTRIGSTVYDGSVRNQLERLGEELAG
ncbi:MAG TPA: ATP synthase F1 subunit delta [Pyrinomonadaceae bacterium]|nr:ATP synthase F1 subunit delta [Pyrinomonadaceae bacterium]